MPTSFWRFAAAAAILACLAAPFDLAASNAVRTSDSVLIGWMVFVTDIGRNIWYLTPAAILFVLAMLAHRTRSEPTERTLLKAIAGHAGFVLAAIGGAALVTSILKRLIGRARPELSDPFGAWHFQPFTFDDRFYSFPSGHSTTIGAVTMVLILWFPRAAAPLLFIGVVLAATRVAALAHWPSDVIAGFSIGIGTALLVARFMASRELFFRLSPGKILPARIGLSHPK